MASASAVAPAAPSAPAPSPNAPEADSYRAPGGEVLAPPATRKLARDLHVDLTRVRPTGHRNHVTKDDVRGFVARHTPHAPTPSLVAVSPAVTCSPVATTTSYSRASCSGAILTQ